MKYEVIESNLKDFDENEVSVFIAHCKEVETARDKQKEIKNKWYKYIRENQLVGLFKKIKLSGLFIDGETVTLSYKGKLGVNYDYQAYKNLVLLRYPETVFDMQVVYEGDSFSFKKANGMVKYNHDIKNPFDNNKEIIGAYCIIKNNRGEFIETINMDEINKIKSKAKTQAIWNEWFARMVLKSVIKRACKTHFNDVIVEIDKVDNEDYDLDNFNAPESVIKMIDDFNDYEKLKDWAISDENKMYHQDLNFTEKVKDKLDVLKLI